MGAVVFIVILVVLFIAMGIVLSMGKGSWLIAGYNTSSPEEKSKYNEKKLCRVTGITCFFVAILLCVMAYLGYLVESGSMEEDRMLPYAFVFIGVLCVTVAIDMIYMNKNCRRDNI